MNRCQSDHKKIASWMCRLLSGIILFAVLHSSSWAEANKYVGEKRCKRCHEGKAKGDQHKMWAKGLHAKALKTLSTPEAKEVAKKLGISDPATSAKCLKCHETSFGLKKSQLAKSFKGGLGVQCESCHGPGEKHFRIRFEAQQEEEEDEDEGDGDVAMTLPKGELTPPDDKLCKKCHNKDSPSFKSYDYCKHMKKMDHWDPRREKKRGAKAFSKRVCK